MAKKKKKIKKTKRAIGTITPKISRVPRLAILGSVLRERDSQRIKFPQRIIKHTGIVRLVQKNKRLPITIGVKDAFRRKTKKENLLQETIRRTIRATTPLLREQRICRSRKKRRRNLFAQGVAGKGKRKSPGRDNHYKFTSDSTVTCKRR